MTGRCQQFGDLTARAAACTACARMAGRSAVLSARNGPVPALVMFVAEAPGRLGGDRTGVPLSGDQAGRNFARLLEAAGIRRDEVFVTNAVLCNPRDAAGNNAPPTPAEIRNCGTFLEETLRVVDPPVVVTLGAVALRALGMMAPHEVVLRDGVATPVRWNDRWLVPLYHPGARAMIHRPFAVQVGDYRRLAGVVGSVRTVMSHRCPGPVRGCRCPIDGARDEHGRAVTSHADNVYGHGGTGSAIRGVSGGGSVADDAQGRRRIGTCR